MYVIIKGVASSDKINNGKKCILGNNGTDSLSSTPTVHGLTLFSSHFTASTSVSCQSEKVFMK